MNDQIVDYADLIRRHEGLRLTPYLDSVGKCTIGWGRNLTDRGITRDEALRMFDRDLRDIVEELRNGFPWFWHLSPVRRAVLIDMGFNLGLPRLRTFQRMIAAIEIRQWGRAADEMLDSKWANQVGARAIELAQMMRSGAYHAPA